LTCAGRGIYWRQIGYEFPRDPGERLLSLVANCTVAVAAVMAGVFAIFFIEEDMLWLYYGIAFVAVFISWVRLNARAVTRSDSIAWRVFYTYLALSPVVLSVLAPASIGIAIACLSWAAWTDYREHFERRWTHWVGVAVALTLAGAFIGISRS
jgi:hypothetical protein